MSPEQNRPPYWISLALCAVLAAGFSYVRLMMVPDRIAGPTLGLPLLICLWNRERSLLWGMTLVFTGAIVYRIFWMAPADAGDLPGKGWFLWFQLGSMMLNVWVVAVVVHLFIGLHERLERRNATLELANAYLESTNKELTARERQISRQHEEIAAKEKQIASMSRELESRREN